MTVARLAPIPALLLASALTGCAADSALVDNLTIVPSYYDTLSCPELVQQVASTSARAKELAGLMEKSGSAVANAIAYNSEYARTRAAQRHAEEAAARKGCDLTKKPDVKPPDQRPPDPKRPRH